MSLKAFQILTGAYVGPDFTADPVEVSSPTRDDPDRVVLQYPPRQYVARTAGSPTPPGQTNVVYSPVDLPAKFNKTNLERFRALGDPPEFVADKFDEAVKKNLDPRQSGEKSSVRPRRLSLVGGTVDSSQSSTSEVGPGKDKAHRAAAADDANDLSDSVLESMSKAELRQCAEDEGAEVNARMSKEELVDAILSNRKK